MTGAEKLAEVLREIGFDEFGAPSVDPVEPPVTLSWSTLAGRREVRIASRVSIGLHLLFDDSGALVAVQRPDDAVVEVANRAYLS